MDPRVQAILDFWFSELVIANGLWFNGDAAFDRAIKERFEKEYEKAAAGAHDAWLDGAESALALIIVLDQFPRNMFRGTARAFATDTKAQAAAATAVERAFDMAVPPQQRLFFYMPFEHAEDLALQERSVTLIRPLDSQLPGVGDFAERHAALIREFGRFPHRNAVLGRRSTPAEVEYLLKMPHEFG